MATCSPSVCRYSTTTNTCIFCKTERPACAHIWTVHDDLSTTCRSCKMDWDEYVASKRLDIPCECGAKSAGFDSHSHWCPLGVKK